MMNSRTLTEHAGTVAIIALLAGITCLLMIAATVPDRETDNYIGEYICIEDDAPFYQDNHPPEFYTIIYPAVDPNVQLDNNGQIIRSDLADPAGTSIMPWIEQSLIGRSPPVLYWPAAGLRNQTLGKHGTKPCTQATPTTEPGIPALIGAALLAAAILK
ncbi:hypothetical protein [Nitrosomonas sp.]|uniref:hypothetical protein n=1 Tax=Nitrosomonas sp. TaxID=42353 RepID=UPI0037C73DAA